MTLTQIPTKKLLAKAHALWDEQWFLLTSGDFSKNDYNTMTVSWGSLGIIWNKPFAQVVVRPTRYTYGFMEQFDSFTLSAFSDTYRKALNLLGSKSGRDGNKIAESGLTPSASSIVAAPHFAEAELVFECRKIYWDDFEPTHFLDPAIHKLYRNDYHRIYFGEILGVFGTEKFLEK